MKAIEMKEGGRRMLLELRCFKKAFWQREGGGKEGEKEVKKPV